MSSLVPSSVTPPDTAAADPRIGHLLADDPTPRRELSAVLIGFPVDEGVERNGGRPGAAAGPDRIRQWLFGLTPDARRGAAFVDLVNATADAGNVSTEGSLRTLQQRLGKVVGRYLRANVTPIILGGGHETAYGHFLGYVAAERAVSILNWDAHIDVRPPLNGRPHSGSSFRDALEHASGRCNTYTVAGLQPHSAAAEHVDYVTTRDGRCIWASEISEQRAEELYEQADRPTLVTFDLDAVDQAQAPGVSAPAVAGLDRDCWLHAAYHAGRCSRISSVDLSELNPRVDVDDRTARLAARTVFQFLQGLCDRRSDA